MRDEVQCGLCGAVSEDKGLYDLCLDCLLLEGLEPLAPGPAVNPSAQGEGEGKGTRFGEYDLLEEVARG